MPFKLSWAFFFPDIYKHIKLLTYYTCLSVNDIHVYIWTLLSAQFCCEPENKSLLKINKCIGKICTCVYVHRCINTHTHIRIKWGYTQYSRTVCEQVSTHTKINYLWRRIRTRFNPRRSFLRQINVSIILLTRGPRPGMCGCSWSSHGSGLGEAQPRLGEPLLIITSLPSFAELISIRLKFNIFKNNTSKVYKLILIFMVATLYYWFKGQLFKNSLSNKGSRR